MGDGGGSNTATTTFENEGASALPGAGQERVMTYIDSAHHIVNDPTTALSHELVRTNPSDAEVVRQGSAAMERLTAKPSWPDWILVMRALEIGRKKAADEAGAPRGRRYSVAFSKWLRLHPGF